MKLDVTNCLACDGSNIADYLETKDMMHSGGNIHQFKKCSDCGLVMLAPRVSLEQLEGYYTDYYLPYRGPSAWGKFAPLVQSDQRKIDKARVKTVKKYHDLSAHSVILDVGCGKPTFLSTLYKDCAAQCYGTDFSSHGWQEEREDYRDLYLHEGLPTQLDLSVKADVITMWHYLEHDYDPFHTLQDIMRHCKSGTKLIIEVPDHDGTTRIRYGSNWAGYHTPRHTALYTVSNLSTLLTRAGWHVLDQYRQGTLDPYTLIWMSKMEQKGIDWSTSMEPRFWAYVTGMLRHLPTKLNKKGRGFMTLIAEVA